MGYGFLRSPASVRTSETLVISCRTSDRIHSPLALASKKNHPTRYIHFYEYVFYNVFHDNKTTPQARQTATFPACAVALRHRGNHGRAGTRQARASRQIQRLGLHADGAGSLVDELRLSGATTAITAITERGRS